MSFLSKLFGYVEAIPDVTIDENIARGRKAFNWNEEQSEIWDRTCVHSFDPVITENGHVYKCIYCGVIE